VELADLVDALRGGPSRARTLVVFFALGGLVAALARLVAPGAPPELVVRVPAGASAAEVERAIDEAVLVELGVELGWRADRVIVGALARGLGFVGMVGEPAALVERAAALDLPRRDPLCRARLVERARAVLARPPEPTDAELAAFHAANSDRFRRPAVVTFVREGPLDLALGVRATRSEPEIARALGAEAAAAVVALPISSPTTPTWSDPIARSMGPQRFAVIGRVPAQVPSWPTIRDEVAGAWRESRRPAQLALGLERLRARHTIRVEAVAP